MHHYSGPETGPLESEPVQDNPRFYDTFMVLYDSYRRKKGRVLDPDQVKILVEAFQQISEDANAMEQALTELSTSKKGKKKLWQKK